MVQNQYRIFASNPCATRGPSRRILYACLSLPQASSADDGFSPPRPPSHSQNAGTPSTLSTSPGESRDWNNARPSAPGAGADTSGVKRTRTGGEFQPPPPPPPPRFSLPQGEREHQVSRGSGTAGGPDGVSKVAQGHARRGSRGTDGGGSPASHQASRRAGTYIGPLICVSLKGVGAPALACGKQFVLLLFDGQCTHA